MQQNGIHFSKKLNVFKNAMKFIYETEAMNNTSVI